MTVASEAIVIHLDDWPEECQLCGDWGKLNYCVPFYEEPVYQDIGSKMQNGDDVGGMTCCKACHDNHWAKEPKS